MLAFTHGQPASPTTLGKEFSNYSYRLKFHLDLMTFSSTYGMPSISYRLADIQRVETGKKWYGALYPVSYTHLTLPTKA